MNKLKEELGFPICRFLEKYLGGYVRWGNVTIYGFNAMHLAVQFWTRRWGYVCFHPPIWFYRWWNWYFYVSPSATPWASTFAIGPGLYLEDKQGAKERRQKYGHNFDDRILHPDIHPEVRQLYPQYFDSHESTPRRI